MESRKKRLVAVLMVVLLIASLVACGGQTEKDASESFNIVIGSGHARTHVYVAMLEDWFVPELVKRAAEMGYEINVTEGYGGTISAAADICESVESGLLGMGGLSFLTEADKFALMGYSSYLPFSSKDPEATAKTAKAVYDANKETFDKVFEDNNQKVLAFLPSGDYQLTTTFPVKAFGDIHGQKIAGIGSNLVWLEGSGAIGVNSIATEGYTSMQTGVYNGWIMYPQSYLSYKFNEVAPYLTMTNFGSLALNGLSINLDLWNSMPADLQNLIETMSWEEYAPMVAAEVKKQDADAEEFVKGEGVVVYELPDSEIQLWVNSLVDKSGPYINDMKAKGIDIEKIISDYYEYAEEYNGYAPARYFGISK